MKLAVPPKYEEQKAEAVGHALNLETLAGNARQGCGG